MVAEPKCWQHRTSSIQQRSLAGAVPNLLVFRLVLTLSENELRTLSPNQQQAIAEIKLSEFRRKERLVRHARTYPGKRWATLIFLILALWVTGKNIVFPYHVVACSVIMLIFTLVHVHCHGINRRLDALLTLRDAEAGASLRDKPQSQAAPERPDFEPPAQIYMRTALWIYFGAIALMCVALSIAISWFGRIIHHAYPGASLPLPTRMLIDYRSALFAIPLLSLIFAIRFSMKGKLRAERSHIVAACSLFVLVLLVCLTLLAIMIPFLPWGIVLDRPAR